VQVLINPHEALALYLPHNIAHAYACYTSRGLADLADPVYLEKAYAREAKIWPLYPYAWFLVLNFHSYQFWCSNLHLKDVLVILSWFLIIFWCFWKCSS